MSGTIDLLARPVYGMAQVDWILRLPGGTARRWIDGYSRGGKTYPPLVRLDRTGEELVTWGEFTETRLLSEFRDSGVPIIRMRPAIVALREQFGQLYPLAHACRTWRSTGGNSVLHIQEEDRSGKAAPDRSRAQRPTRLGNADGPIYTVGGLRGPAGRTANAPAAGPRPRLARPSPAVRRAGRAQRSDSVIAEQARAGDSQNAYRESLRVEQPGGLAGHTVRVASGRSRASRLA